MLMIWVVYNYIAQIVIYDVQNNQVQFNHDTYVWDHFQVASFL